MAKNDYCYLQNLILTFLGIELYFDNLKFNT